MERIDLDKISQEELMKSIEQSKLLFKFNHTEPMTEEYAELLNELLEGNIGENSTITTPFAGAAFDKMKLGNNVFINSNCLAMARGGITIEDDVMLAGNVQLLSNNHDEYERQILTCEEILIKRGAWLGAGVTILAGVTVGKYAIVGAGAIVTKDVPDYAVVVGAPAKVVKTLDKDRFPE
ncbi:acyltransferase [Methanobrevibacter sp.]|uniref:acyltransferase n=1 Tax=Methanobrevibacter sp. TaxID=66852 RepID=UPI003870C0ED